MPQALALALFNVGAPLAVVNAVLGIGVAGTILYTGVYLGVSVGLSLLLRPAVPKPSDGQLEFKQPIPDRVWHYGRTKVAGPLAFYEGDGGNFLYKIVVLSSREMDAIEAIVLDDELATRDPVDGAITDRYLDSGAAQVYVWPYLGLDSQAADATLVAAFPGIWTTNHRLRGVSYVVVRMLAGGNPTSHAEIYAQGEPQIKILGRFNKVYDLRLDSTVAGGSGVHRHGDKATWSWSENAALAVLDFLTHADGYNRPIAKMDLPSFQAMANICDENVSLKAGGTEDRYRIAASVSLREPRTDVLKRLLEACDATLEPKADGTWKIAGGEWIEPTVTLDADRGHIIEAEFRGGASAMERYNELAIQYLSPAHDYSEVEGDPWQNAADIAASGIIETRPLNLLQVPSHGQARRLAKIRMARDNPEWVGTLRTNFYGLDAIGERCITVKWPELNIDGPFWVKQVTMLADGTGVEIEVSSASEASYDWDEDAEEGTAPTVPTEVAL